MTLRHHAKRLLERVVGLRVYRRLPHGLDLHHDLARLGDDIRTIIDVGANVGQAALRFREEFPRAVIHSFEPVRSTFAVLEKNLRLRDCHCHPYAMGSRAGRKTIYVRSTTTTSSLIEPGDYVGTEEVEVRTLDEWSQEHAIDTIDVLKIDTEGFDLEVLAGATELLKRGAIRFLVAEVGFEAAQALVPFEAVRSVLASHGMSFIGLYHQTMDWGGKKQLVFADALFARPT